MSEKPEELQTIVCSICSKVKSTEAGKLPARQRYQGSHIGKVEAIALEQGVPFFILSGRFGLLAADEGVESYDYLLIEEDVQRLADEIQVKLYEHKIGVVHFYTKLKPQWEPYGRALAIACSAAKVRLITHRFGPND